MIVPEIHSYWIDASGHESAAGDEGARFPYWSFTKTIMAICALRLGEESLLDLDARLNGQPYTLRQLLSHRAGLSDYGLIAEYHRAVAAHERPWPRGKVVDKVLGMGQLFSPGEGWSYSNVGYMFAKDRLEDVAGMGFGRLVSELICQPLRLESIELAETREQFSTLHWPAAAQYDPAWVYHGCLTGTARDAAAVVHALYSGDLLRADALEQMHDTYPLGGAIAGRPWTACGYALGLMNGTMAEAGRAMGHSGGGPFSVNAVYHFPDRSEPLTVACFSDGTDEGVPEHEAARLAARR
jgi:D-alanyl-D-alanine carboxypeptidase